MESVSEGAKQFNFKAVNFMGLIPYLIKSIQEQQDMISNIHHRNKHLSEENEALEKIITGLESRIEIIEKYFEKLEVKQ